MARRSLAALAALVVLSSASPALAYQDVGYDPLEGEGNELDIRSSRRRVEVTDRGRRLILSVTAVSDTTGFDYWVKLDSRRGRRPDFLIHMTDATGGPLVCDVRRVGTRALVAECLMGIHFGERGQRVTARLPARHVNPNKRIRWWVDRRPLLTETSDRAPDRGWYPN